MANQEKMFSVLITGQTEQQMVHGAIGRETGNRLQVRFHLNRRGNDFRGLARAQNRAGQNPVKRNF